MHDLIQVNKFSELHNGETIIFCKTDFLLQEFENIESLKRDVVLINGNSDYPITDGVVIQAPTNIKKWYAQNALSHHEKIIPIPIGIENKNPSQRGEHHGVGYHERVSEKELLLSRSLPIEPTRLVYANFKLWTHPYYRAVVKDVCVDAQHIDWEDPDLSLEQFFTKILDYKMVVCPIGNGVDTHRLWEVLYSNRVPITIKVEDYKIYNLYEEYPIIVLDYIEQLNDQALIEAKYQEVQEKVYDKDMLDYGYWKQMILEEQR